MQKLKTLALLLLIAVFPALATVTLPVEVIGPNGYYVSEVANIPSGSVLTGAYLWLKIHGLRFDNQAYVKVNSSSWIPINSTYANLTGNGAIYGGIGGGFSTLTMYVPLASGTVTTGNNTFSFYFSGTDGRVSGFRVLSFNAINSSGTSLIPNSEFTETNPNTWTPPLNDPTDIAAGLTLWQTATLTAPPIGGGTNVPITAHCADCHTHDGHDLKYFNYSNNSIEVRSAFHGLSTLQGEQIASYIRSLTFANPGRPWNPPYQPGAGLDSGALVNWAAGAGLGAVVGSDDDVMSAIFPSGYPSTTFAASNRLSQRETPIQFQMPDWNQWLPATYPGDYYGSTFTSSLYYSGYYTLLSNLNTTEATYVAQKGNFTNWFSGYFDFALPLTNGTPPDWTNPAVTDAIYSVSQWGLVKQWDLMTTNQLEGFNTGVNGSGAEPRGWFSELIPFYVAPHEQHMPTTGEAGLRNGTAEEYTYLTTVWYHLQLLLNDGGGNQNAQYPIDWAYMYGFIQNIGVYSTPQAGFYTLWNLKGLEVMDELGLGPQYGTNGYQPFVAQPSYLVTREWRATIWGLGSPPSAQYTAIADGIATAWLNQVTPFTQSEFVTGGWFVSTAYPVAGGNLYSQAMPDWVWAMIPRFQFIGVDSGTINGLIAWAATIWPDSNFPSGWPVWEDLTSDTCSYSTDTFTINCAY
jgi:hypothetical protein